MVFLALDDILVLNKDNGMVRRIVDGVMLEQPMDDVNVGNQGDRGMLGIAIAKNLTTDDDST
jgi:hypothetical protein